MGSQGRMFGLVVVACAVAGGCRPGARSPSAPTLVVPPAAPAAATHEQADARQLVLLWTRGADGGLQTWTLDADDGVLSRTPGVLVAAGAHVWRWRESQGPVATTACPGYDAAGNELPPGPPPAPGRGVRAALVPDDGAVDEQEVVAKVEGDGAEQVDQDAELVASAGPYLFVRSRVYAYACGAHGNVGVDFLVWDAASRTAAWTSGAPGFTGFAADWAGVVPREEATRELGADPDVSGFPQGDAGLQPELTEILPSYGPDGRLDVSFQLTAPTCYACSDGAWSSYTKSTRQPARDVPAALRRWASPPAAVERFARTHGDLTVGGWSFLGAR